MFFHSATHWGWFSFSRADSRAATAGWHWLLLQGCRTVHYIKQVYAINDAARGAQTDGQREGQRQGEREREGRGDSWLHGRTLATEAGLRAANRNTHTHTQIHWHRYSLSHTHTHSRTSAEGGCLLSWLLFGHNKAESRAHENGHDSCKQGVFNVHF